MLLSVLGQEVEGVIMQDWEQIANLVLFSVGAVVVFFFLLYWPQHREDKKRKLFQASLSKGSHVITAGGVHGVIKALGERTVLLEITPRITVKVDRMAILKMEKQSEHAPKPDKSAARPQKGNKQNGNGTDGNESKENGTDENGTKENGSKGSRSRWNHSRRNRSSGSKPNENKPNENKPVENKPDENRLKENRPEEKEPVEVLPKEGHAEMPEERKEVPAAEVKEEK